MKKKIKFYVYTPPFNENSGGPVVLHRLNTLLNENGENSSIVHIMEKPDFQSRKTIFKKLTFPFKLLKYYYKTNIEKNSVVIYPEVISGNPLKAKYVVRWLLHKPGFHTGVVDYGENDIYFYYQEIFNDIKLNPHTDRLLNISWFRKDIFKKTNFGERNGSCYMLRKGKGRKIVHDLENSILLDGMSNNEIAQIMNQCEYFISYDTETMYSSYAVLCGCKSVVIPRKGISKEQWQPDRANSAGVAYGFDDIKNVEGQVELQYEYLKKQEDKSNESVKKFIKKIYELVD